MKNRQKIGLLIAFAVAGGGAGVWSELHAATNVRLAAVAVIGNNYAEVDDNGNGTALAVVQAPLADGFFLSGFEPNISNFSIAVDVRPGQSGGGTGSGTASATFNAFTIDPTGTVFTPALAHVDLVVANATNVAASVNQGVRTEHNPLTGETVVNRVHQIGNQAYGDTVGTSNISVDGNALPAETGVFGVAASFSVHSVVRIR